MKMFHFPARFHKTQPIRNAAEIFEAHMTLGQRVADGFAKVMGSWTFIIIQSLLLTLWVIVNIVAWVKHWDPYPFILMNLVLSIQAAYAAPIIMMSANRQAERDRIEAHNDYLVNKKSEEEVHVILEHNAAQNDALTIIYEKLLKIESDLASVTSNHQTVNNNKPD